MGEPIVAAHNVRKQYFRKTRDAARYFDALPQTSLELAAGELVEVTGRSGSGKTTLLSIMAGLLEPSEGTVLVGGQDLYALDDAARSRLRNEHFGVVPQGQTPLSDLTVLENVCMPYGIYHDVAQVQKTALELLERLSIADLSESYPCELSGGEIRRMAIARALVCHPDVVFADEPTGDLDDDNTHMVLRTLREVAEDGAAVMLVTHEAAAKTYASRVVHMG